MLGTFYLKSSYSMLDSLVHLEELVKSAKENKYEFVALTDDFLHGTIEFFDLTKKNNIKPILGMTLTVNEPNEDIFLLYVKNEEGYKNLLKLSYLKSDKRTLKLDDLVKHQKGLIIVSGGYKSLIDQTIMYGNQLDVSNYINLYNELFDDFYIGISINYEIQKKITFNYLYNLALENKYKMLLVHQTNYINKNDKYVYDALTKVVDINNEVTEFADFSMLSFESITSIFSKYPEILKHQTKLIESINFKLSTIKYQMPIFRNSRNISPKEFIYSLAHKGLSRRLKLNKITNYEPYVERLDHELNIINQMGFENYFLIVYDFVKYAKQNNILVGPGRGSAAGSLVSYSLGITEIDPIKYNLMFERFLNPERTSMPDIDLDFPDNKRDDVINYVRRKYGDEHISSITTFSRLQVKSSIRDISRVLHIPLERVAGIIQAVENNRVDKTDFEVAKVLDIASKISGLYRQTGTHAAGIILADNNLFESIPMQKGAFEFAQAQYDMETLESLGLIKIDFLGIRNLTIITDILNKLTLKGIKIDLNNLPLNDTKTYDLLSSGNTTGIFQLESNGMRRVLQKLKPEVFEDIVATLALFRPGPMANIDIYIARKKGEPFKYLHDDLKDILSSTYGIIIYQEQIMQIAVKFAGYNLFEADMLRVGVSKKDRNILEQEKNKFVNSAVKQGYDKNLAIEIYNYILEFANYGFNRSHSVAYSLVAYQMAYLKANYYSDFMAVLLDGVVGNESQTRNYLEEVSKRGIDVLLPNINESIDKYVIKDNSLLLPLTQIKGIGFKTYKEIVEERNNNGKFTDFSNLKERLNGIINESQLQSLINAGALDMFGFNRNTLLSNANLSSAGLERYIKDFVMQELKELPFEENQKLELLALGVNLKFNLTYIIKSNKQYSKYQVVSDLKKLSPNNNYIVCGMINNKKEFINKNNETMMFMDFTDGLETISIVVFGEKYKETKELEENVVLCLTVRKTMYNKKESYQYINLMKGIK